MCGFVRSSPSYVYLPLPTFVRRLTFLDIDVGGLSNGFSLGRLSSKYYSDTPRHLILHERQSIVAGKYAVSKVALYVRTRVLI